MECFSWCQSLFSSNPSNPPYRPKSHFPYPNGLPSTPPLTPPPLPPPFFPPGHVSNEPSLFSLPHYDSQPPFFHHRHVSHQQKQFPPFPPMNFRLVPRSSRFKKCATLKCTKPCDGQHPHCGRRCRDTGVPRCSTPGCNNDCSFSKKNDKYYPHCSKKCGWNTK